MPSLEELLARLESLKRIEGFFPVEWANGAVRWLDTSKLPWEERFEETRSVERLAEAVKNLEIRGAPAIGVAAALGVAMAAYNAEGSLERVASAAREAIAVLSKTRPTAYNLFWALQRMAKVLEGFGGESAEELKERLLEEALKVQLEDLEANLKIGEHGAELVDDGDVVLTHCNAGTLATSGFGTALSVIKAAWRRGKKIEVVASETRPLLQGARLTAWELKRAGIPFKLVTDGAVGYVFAEGLVDKVVVGADRILLSGHVANKIGTYTIAVLARAHGKPFYVAAPTSTVDPASKPGDFKIEHRSEEEVLTVLGKLRIAPQGARALNPAFDVTPPEYVDAIITEVGVARRPVGKSLKKLLGL